MNSSLGGFKGTLIHWEVFWRERKCWQVILFCDTYDFWTLSDAFGKFDGKLSNFMEAPLMQTNYRKSSLLHMSLFRSRNLSFNKSVKFFEISVKLPTQEMQKSPTQQQIRISREKCIIQAHGETEAKSGGCLEFLKLFSNPNFYCSQLPKISFIYLMQQKS